MTVRLLTGSLLSYFYNSVLGKLPCTALRNAYLRRYLVAMGDATNVQMGCQFLNGRKISLGPRNAINFGCLFDGRRYSIRTGSDVSIGPEASILTLGHDPQSASFADRGGDVTIGDRVWIAYRAIILPGITVGEGAVVAAGAVVTKEVAPYAIVAGSPARVVGERTRDVSYELHFSPFLV